MFATPLLIPIGDDGTPFYSPAGAVGSLVMLTREQKPSKRWEWVALTFDGSAPTTPYSCSYTFWRSHNQRVR
jgi:hypothetical protein